MRYLLIAALLLMTSCDRKRILGNSSVKSSSNSALSYSTTRVQVAKSQCSGNHQVLPELITPKKGLYLEGATNSSVNELKRALTNIPTELQKLFYKINGRIYITNKAKEICAQNPVESHESSSTCSYLGKSGAYYLVVESDPVRITDATIEGFGYVLAQLLRNLSIENNQLVTNKKSPFNEALKGLSAKFINEIRKKPAYSMDAYDVRLDKSLPVGTNLRSCDIPDSALQRSFDSAAFALHFRATHCSVASRSLDIAFQADSKAYYDQYMTPFIQALLDGKRLDYIPPKSCSAVAYAGGFDISKFFDALLNFSQNSNTACSLWSCANAPSGSDAMSNDSNKDLFSPFSTADGSTVWGGSGDDSYSDSILSNTDLSANGLGSSMANSFGAVTDSNGDPLGDFARTCVDEIWQDDILKMKCMGTDGKLYNSQIPRSEIDKCTNDGDQINNINGSIQCGDYSYAVDSDNPVEDDYDWCSKNDDTRNGWGQENGKPCRANPRELSDAWTSNDPSINSDSSSNDEYNGEMNGNHSCSDQRKWHGCEPSWMKGTCGCPDE